MKLMEFCLNFSVGFTTPPLMLVIRNLVLVHKVKSKEAVCRVGEGGGGWVCTSVHSIRGPTVVISKYNNLKRLVPTGPSFKGQEAFQSISEYEI